MIKGKIKPVYNEDILAEYIEVLHRPKFHLSEKDISFTLDYIRHYGVHSDRVPRPYLRHRTIASLIQSTM